MLGTEACLKSMPIYFVWMS